MPISPELATLIAISGLSFGGLLIFLMGLWQERRWARAADRDAVPRHPAE